MATSKKKPAKVHKKKPTRTKPTARATATAKKARATAASAARKGLKKAPAKRTRPKKRPSPKPTVAQPRTINAKGTRVLVGGVKSPLVLEDTGPKPTKSDLAAFEAHLGLELPADYRAFLSKYNGGDPVVGDVRGRDDDPTIAYQHGDSVNSFLKVPVKGKSMGSDALLRASTTRVPALPADTLAIAEDAGGNAFVLALGARRGEIRFVDHESSEPFEKQRVMAESFSDLLQRFRSVEEQKRLDELEGSAEREGIRSGPLPTDVASQCDLLEAKHPNIRAAVRSACLAIFDAKGFFAVHDDPLSHALLDLVLWMALSTSYPDGLSLVDFQSRLLVRAWGARPPATLGFQGYAPAFIASWWNRRAQEGALVLADDRGRLSPDASTAIAAKVDQLA